MNRLLRRALLVVGAISCVALANPSLAQTSLEKTTVSYRKVNGVELLADMYRPKGDGVRPVIVYLHGGALIGASRQLSTKDHVHARLLSLAEENGYAIVSFDYRLTPEAKLPAIVSDIEAAFSWLGSDGAKRFHLNADRLLVIGDSAGGYLALVTGYRVHPKPKALVALYGYGELNADWYAKPSPYPRHNRNKITREEAMQQTDGAVISDAEGKDGRWKIYFYYRQNGLWPQEVSGFSPESLAKEIAPYEPVKNVTREFPPTLLIHGTLDTDVPFEESVKMATQFREHGVPYILLPIDKAEHSLVGGSPAQVDDAFRTIREFTIRFLEAQ